MQRLPANIGPRQVHSVPYSHANTVYLFFFRVVWLLGQTLCFVDNPMAASFGCLPVAPREQALTHGQQLKIWSVSSRSFHVHDSGEEARPGGSGLSRMCDPLAATKSPAPLGRMP
jgi:hypothetical protein